MRKVQTALLAAIFGATSVGGALVSQATHPGLSAVALADDDHGNRGEHHNRGKHRGWYNNNGCNGNSNRRHDDDEERDDDDNRGGYNNGGYNNGGYNNGQYGQNGQYGNCYGNGRYGNGQYGNSTVSGTIVAVSGNTVTLLRNFQTITINDQPALDNQTSGRVAVGRSVTAYGYWQGGIFYATRMV